MATPPLLRAILERFAARQELALVVILVLTMAMMILPIPTVLADVLIAGNIGLAMLLMMVAVHISGPVEFSTLPSVILITTAFRLSLSITTSRMVLVQADAGDIIRTFGEFVIAGNVVVGLVVYLIITIVQFVVITKGSERVAEVAARFTLDALPGKQISIDTDLKNGDIDQKEARGRRRTLEKESQLYGAMDGAMKFVKGDAIASLVIIVVNLVGGMTIGCLQRGMPFGEAVRTYSLLAVGDGLIAQIPALLISLTAGVIVTRVTSEAGGNLGRDIIGQLTGEPRTLQIAALVLAALALVPGFPAAVFLTLAIVLGATGWTLAGRAKASARRFAEAHRTRSGETDAAALTIAVGSAFGTVLPKLDEELELLRREVATSLGVAVPRLRTSLEGGLEPLAWRFDINGVPAGAGLEAAPDGGLAPVRLLLRRNAEQFVGIQETQKLLHGMEPTYADLVREATKAAPLIRLAETLRRLLREQVSIANLRTILETVAEWGAREPNTAILAEQVRVALGRQICFALAGPGKIVPVVLVDATLDEALRAAIIATSAGLQLVLDPAVAEALADAVRLVGQRGAEGIGTFALLASADIRRHLRAFLSRQGIDTPVLTHAELAPDFRLEVIDTLRQARVMPSPATRPIRDVPHLAVVDA